MWFYHSVAINIVIDLLEVLGLNQIANFFLMRMQARTLCIKVCRLCLHVKVRETRPMGHKLICTNLTNMFQDFTGLNPNLFFIITWSLMQVTSLLNKLDLGYKFDCVMCFVSDI